jgi:hypothetical protein
VLPRPTFHRIATFAVLLLCVVLALRGVPKGLRPGGNDFTIYYDAARALLDGRDPVLVRGSIYPPSFDVLLVPFALLPYAAALMVWQALACAALFWGWRRSLQMLGAELERRPWVPWLSLLAVARLADSTFAYGQVNTITFALVAEAVFRWRAGRILAPAFALGVGAALKILPALLGAWPLLRGAWRASAASAVAVALCMGLLPLVALGPERALTSMENWRVQVWEPASHAGEKLLDAYDYVPGQSLTAACYRIFSATPATSEGARGPRSNLFEFSLSTTHRIVLALCALHAAVWAATLWRRRRSPFAGRQKGQDANEGNPRDLCFMLEAGLSIAMILVLAPVVQKAHMVWLLLPYVALLGIPSSLKGRRRKVREGLVCASILLIGATAPALLGDALATRLISANVVFLGLECAVGALLLELWGRGEFVPSPE